MYKRNNDEIRTLSHVHSVLRHQRDWRERRHLPPACPLAEDKSSLAPTSWGRQQTRQDGRTPQHTILPLERKAQKMHNEARYRTEQTGNTSNTHKWTKTGQNSQKHKRKLQQGSKNTMPGTRRTRHPLKVITTLTDLTNT